MHTQLLSLVHLFEAPWTVACQVSLSIGFSTQEYWSGLPFPSSRNLPDPGTETYIYCVGIDRRVLYH